MSVFSFRDDNFSLYEWIFTKLDVCIEIVETLFGIADGQFSSELSSRDTSVFSYLDDNFSKYQWIFTKLGMCINIVEICFGIANGQILSIFDRDIFPQYIRIFLAGQ